MYLQPQYQYVPCFHSHLCTCTECRAGWISSCLTCAFPAEAEQITPAFLSQHSYVNKCPFHGIFSVMSVAFLSFLLVILFFFKCPQRIVPNWSLKAQMVVMCLTGKMRELDKFCSGMSCNAVAMS